MIKAAILLGIIGMVASSIIPQILPVYPKYRVVPVVKAPLVKYPVVPVAKYPVVPVAKVPVVPNHLPVVKVPAVLPLTKIAYETIPQPYVRDYRFGGYKNLGYLKHPEFFGGYKSFGYTKYPEYLGYKGFSHFSPFYGYGNGFSYL